MGKPMTKILKVPKEYLMPIVAALSMVGAFAISNRPFDITIAFVFGVIGYFLDKMKYSPAPIVLGIILGNMIDENFRRSLMVSGGDPMTFITHPLSAFFLVIIVFTVVSQIIKTNKAKKKQEQ